MAATIEEILRSGDSRYALHAGYGLVEILDLPPRRVKDLGEAVAISPVKLDLADLLTIEGESAGIELHDEVVLGWIRPDEVLMDLSVRWVHPSELTPINSIKPEVREKLTSGKRYIAYLNGESMEARGEFLPGPYPVAMEISGRLIHVSRYEKVVELAADETWLLRAYYQLLMKIYVGPPIRVKKSRRLSRLEKEKRAAGSGCTLPSLSTTTMEDVLLRIDEPVDDEKNAPPF